jgi:hypothetical protein
VTFFRDPGGQSGGKLYMVDVTGRVEQPVPTPSFASDPTWSPLCRKRGRAFRTVRVNPSPVGEGQGEGRAPNLP